MVCKQIIIDGVDVSECNFCEWKSSDIPQCRIRLASFEPTCKGYNCHYKQLKHKEQECDKYKQALDEIEKFAQDIVNTKEWINCSYNALKAELILDIINEVKEQQ